MNIWKTLRISDLAEIHNKVRIPLNSRQRSERKGNFPYYGASGIVDYIKNYIFDGEFVLISEDGENLNSRNTPIAFKVAGKFWVNNHAHIVKGKEKFINDWLVYFFALLDLTPYITGAVQPKLSKENLLSIPIPYPGDIIAKRIVEILSSLDDKIELNRRMNQTMEQMAQTLFQKYSEVDEFVPLTDLVELNPKLTLRKGTVSQYVEMSNLSETAASIKQSVQREYSGGAKFQNNDTLLARITPCLENGKTGFVDILEEGEFGFGSTEYIVMRAKQKVSPYFVYCVARDTAFREHAMRSMTGTSGRQRVQNDMLMTYELPKWSPESMETFHTSVHAYFQKIKANSAEIKILTTLRDTLLPKLMSGEIDVMQTQPEALHEPVLS